MPQYPQVMTQKRAAQLWHIDVAPPPETNPPVNINIPQASIISGDGSVGSILRCTVGIWDNMGDLVDTYAFAWQRNAVPITGGSGISEDYTTVAADSGTDLTCIVSATNTIGTTAAPPSNAINIT
jgi:hypothetical protein